MIMMQSAFIRSVMPEGRRRRNHRFWVDAARAEVLHRLAQSGCFLCREELVSLDRFFFWYLTENYGDASTVSSMQRSHGFCRRHTRHLLARGQPSSIASIYQYLVGPVVRSLRSSASNVESPRVRERLVRSLLPIAVCPACADEHRACDRLLSSLRTGLHDSAVQDALLSSSSICVRHFLHAAPVLRWEEFQMLGRATVRTLERPGLSLDSSVASTSGRDRDAAIRPSPERASTLGSADKAPLLAGAASSLFGLHHVLSQPGCPICLARRQLLHEYLTWLGNEVTSAPQHQWSDAVWLCPVHAWDFWSTAPPRAGAQLAETVRLHWSRQLQGLLTALEHKPPEHLSGRLRRVPAYLREAAADGPYVPSLRGRLAVAVRRLRATPDRRLQRLRVRTLRRVGCPACGHLTAAAERVAHLLVRALGDREMRTLYQCSDGVCFRDLPLVLRCARTNYEAQLLITRERVRLELLEWELRELQRKISWTVRFESRGAEQSAWARAAEQFTGAGLAANDLIGL
jgi:hypothetical protein